MAEERDRAEDEREHESDLPEPGREPEDPSVAEEEAAAAREAGRIGGRSGMEDMDPAERATAEAGGGVAEGFEQAEERLRETASHGDGRGADPLKDAGEPEGDRARGEYSEADHVDSTETDEETQGTAGDFDGSADDAAA